MFSLSDLFNPATAAGPPDSTNPKVLYGVILTPGGFALQRVKDQLDRMYDVRVARLDGIPGDWLIRVRELQRDNPGYVVTIAPSRRGDVRQSPADDRAWFLNTTEKCDAWMTIFHRCQDIVAKYSANPDPWLLTEFLDWIGNDEVWGRVGNAFSDTGHAIVADAEAVGGAVADVVSNIYEKEKQGFADVANWWNENLNPFTMFKRFSGRITAIVISIVVVVALFFLWRSGLLAAASKAIPAAKKTKAKTP